MGAAKANNNRDTYRATAVTLIVFGILYLVDKLIHFSSIGLPWVLNFGLITALLGTMSAYLLPVALLVLGIILYWLATR